MDTNKFRALLVGDPHATVNDLKDCGRLVDCIVDVIKKESPDTVVFLGDQHHNHAVVRVEVIDFWRAAYRRIQEALGPNTEIVCLVGNHDCPGDTSSAAHAMQAYEDLVRVVDRPWALDWEGEGKVMLLPYYHDVREFVSACNSWPASKTLICHQAFNGSKYDNGFYVPDGPSPDAIPQQYVISGHIHTPQENGKVWYPGAPRWRIVSDANIERNVWVVDFENGIPVKKTPYPTSGYCKSLYEIEDREGRPEPDFLVVAPCLVTVSIYGSREYIANKRSRWEAVGYRVRGFPTDSAAPKVRESEGIVNALQKFVAAYQPKYGTSQDRLQKMVSERVNI